MTKENREKAYKHYRDLETNYEALPHLDSNITSTVNVRERAKKSADDLLLKYPELAELDKPVEEKPIVNDEKPLKETKSKGKK